MDVYTQNGDVWREYKIFIEKNEIDQTVLEILFFENQYFEERSNHEAMYEQKNYFYHKNNYFNWLHAYPEDEKTELSYVLSSYELFYYDNKGEKFPVKIENKNDIIKDISQINEQFEIGNSKKWSTLFYRDKEYKNYNEAVISCIDKHLLDKKLKENNKKSRKIKV